MDTVLIIVFFALGVVALGAALLAVLARSLGSSVVWLVSSLAAVAALVCLLQAPFVGIVQGLAAVVVTGSLLMFAVRHAEVDPLFAARQLVRGWWFAALGALVLGGLVLVPTFFSPGLPGGGTWPRTDFAAPAAAEGGIGGSVAGIADVGRSLMNEYLLPFEIAAVVLLIGLVGAIVLVRDAQPDDRTATATTSKRRARIYSVE
jgi:NADH-quinone oxidoreductase subunit J